MKSKIIFFVASIFAQFLSAQAMRYFESTHRDQQPGDDWRDSAYVVATNDPALLAQIAIDLALPVGERRHINGPIGGGDGGFNRNASFWFSWHHVPNQWALAEVSIELCDGRPYKDVEADTAYWVGVVGQFCGWSYCVSREISAPVSTPEPPEQGVGIRSVFPNPAAVGATLSIAGTGIADGVFVLQDVLGRVVFENQIIDNQILLDKSRLTAGVYFFKIMAQGQLVGSGKVSLF